MSLQNEDGAQWFKKGWERGRPQSLSEAVFDEYQPEPEPLWNSPCTPPEKPGIYLVATGADFDENEGEHITLASRAHWNGLRWSKPGPVYKGLPPNKAERAFNRRQDYPWREIAA